MSEEACPTCGGDWPTARDLARVIRVIGWIQDAAPESIALLPDAERSPTVDVVTAGRALGIGATRSYELAQSGQMCEGVPVLRVAGKYRVATAVLRRALGMGVNDD